MTEGAAAEAEPAGTSPGPEARRPVVATAGQVISLVAFHLVGIAALVVARSWMALRAAFTDTVDGGSWMTLAVGVAAYVALAELGVSVLGLTRARRGSRIVVGIALVLLGLTVIPDLGWTVSF